MAAVTLQVGKGRDRGFLSGAREIDDAALAEGAERHLLRYLAPGAEAHSTLPVFLLALPAGPPRAHHVAGRVHEVRGLAGGTYQVPFVVMDDFVVAYEAPLGIPATRQVISEIRKVAGDKPIRYVVVSHFHADHAGGVGAYAEIGATILSSTANRAILETYARNNRPRFQGQEGPRSDVAIVFEAVPPSGRTIVDARGGKLNVVDFPGNSHVEGMLALHDPESGILMGADHHISAVAWNPTFQRTAQWTRQNSSVKLVLGTHDAPMSREALLARASEEGKKVRR